MQSRVQVQMGTLDPVGQLLVGEAVPVARRNQQSFREHGGGPAGGAGEPLPRHRPPREHRLEPGPVQLPLPGPEAPPGGFVHLPGDPRREPSYGRTTHPVPRGEPYGDAQAHQVEVGGENLVPPGTATAPGGRRPADTHAHTGSHADASSP
ncbi:hypothetical protein SGFS_038390 [Streptomyces graminofaciens]|uniref:Uncharacterized protein n=1 Tax=Streptomyces graminofaciens TaxID=68212 RepID=A0ABM7F999_9ACTN|nr:hypothetical protein SGFS_038390 [Streptomyces graminofaciens]